MPGTVIIGGGPAGAAVGAQLEDSIIVDQGDRPKSICGGGLGKHMVEKLGLKAEETGALMDDIDKVHIYSDNEKATISNEELGVETLGHVFDRPKFDKYLLKHVKGRYWPNTKAVNVEQQPSGTWEVILDGGWKLLAEHVVFADGATTLGSKFFDTKVPQEDMHLGVQYHTDEEVGSKIKMWFDSEKSPGGYIWQFTTGDGSKVGLGVPLTYGNKAKQFLDSFMAESGIKPLGKVESALIPTAKIPSTVSKNTIHLVGDASKVTDPITGGGIYNSMAQGYSLGEAIRTGDFSSYNEFMQELKADNEMRYRLKQVFYGWDGEQKDRLLRTLSDFEITSIDPREQIPRLIVHILKRDPGLIPTTMKSFI